MIALRRWSERAYQRQHGILGALHPRLALCQWTSDIGLRSLKMQSNVAENHTKSNPPFLHTYSFQT